MHRSRIHHMHVDCSIALTCHHCFIHDRYDCCSQARWSKADECVGGNVINYGPTDIIKEAWHVGARAGLRGNAWIMRQLGFTKDQTVYRAETVVTFAQNAALIKHAAPGVVENKKDSEVFDQSIEHHQEMMLASTVAATASTTPVYQLYHRFDQYVVHVRQFLHLASTAPQMVPFEIYKVSEVGRART